MTNKELKQIIKDMFYDYNEPASQRGAMDCVKELTGEGWRLDSPYLKVYVLRKLLGITNMFVIKYGRKDKYRKISKYHFTLPELFFNELDAYNFARKPSIKYINLIGQPFSIKKI